MSCQYSKRRRLSEKACRVGASCALAVAWLLARREDEYLAAPQCVFYFLAVVRLNVRQNLSKDDKSR